MIFLTDLLFHWNIPSSRINLLALFPLPHPASGTFSLPEIPVDLREIG